MKRKFFSKLLMGAIAIATISFVACKDYDDDINSLQEQINKAALADNVSALQSKLDALTTSSASALTTAENALKAANDAATKDALESVREAAKKAGEDAADAIKAANAAQASANGAQASADAAQAAANAAQSAADAAAQTASKANDAVNAAKEAAAEAEKAVKEAAATAAAVAAAQKGVDANSEEILKLKAQLETFANAQQNYATQKALKDEIDGLKKIIDEAIANGQGFNGNVSLTAEQARTLFGEKAAARFLTAGAGVYSVQQVVDGMVDVIEELWSAVTSVSLYVAGGWQTHGVREVCFLNTNEKGEGAYKFPANENITDKQIEFEGNNKKVTYVDTIVIRVSPTNAQLTGDMVSLINSQGVEISKDLISVEVFPYEKVLTRAASSNGLWKVALKLKDEYTKEEFNAVSEYEGKDVLFAVAVNNTMAEIGQDRRVISEYDIYLNEGTIQHAWNFYVNDTNVKDIHNRWQRAEDGTQTYWPTNDKKNIVELVWLNGYEKAVTESAVSEENSNDRYNYLNSAVDNRQNNNCFVAEQGVPIRIDFRNLFAPDAISERFSYKPIRAFYVTLDQNFAVESAPSEINAWRSYSYKNVGFTKYNGEIVKAHLFEGNTGEITIEDMNGVRGDIIGFRVYAVNYDGTVYDPDGRAFYVLVGNVAEDIILPEVIEVTATANQGDEAVIDVPAGTFAANANKWSRPEWTKDNPYIANITSRNSSTGEPRGSFYKPVAETIADFIPRGAGSQTTLSNYATDAMFTLAYSEDGETWQANPSENTVKVKVILNEAQSMIDEEVYTIKFKCQKETQSALGATVAIETLQNVTVKIKKVLPTNVPELIVKAAQAGNINPLKVYMKPVIGYPTGIAWGSYSNIWNINNKGNVVYGKDIKPFDFADIFTNLQTPLSPNVDEKNYKFEIEQSDLKAEGEYVSTFSKYGYWDLAKNRNNIYNGVSKTTYTVPYGHTDKIEDDVTKKVFVHYSYPWISLTEDLQKTLWSNIDCKEDYSDKFSVKYLCALRMENISKTAMDDWPTHIAYSAAAKAAAAAKTAADKVATDAKADSTKAQKAYDTAAKAVETAQKAVETAQKTYDTAKEKYDADPTATNKTTMDKAETALNEKKAALTTAQTDAATAQADLDTAKDAKVAADIDAEQKAADKKVADDNLEMAVNEFKGIYVVAYEDDWHAVPMDALYFAQKEMAYLGLSADGYASRSELPLKDCLNVLLSNNYLQIDPTDIYLYLADDKTKTPNEDYFKPVLSYTYQDRVTKAGTTIPAIVLRKTRNTEEPALTDNVKFKIHFTVEDVFGHRHPYDLDITMNKPKLKDASRKF